MKKSVKVVRLKKQRVKICTGCGRIWIEHKLGGCAQCGWLPGQRLVVTPLAGTESQQPFMTSFSCRSAGNAFSVMDAFNIDSAVARKLFDMSSNDGEYVTHGGVLKKGRFRKFITVQHNGPTAWMAEIQETMEKAI